MKIMKIVFGLPCVLAGISALALADVPSPRDQDPRNIFHNAAKGVVACFVASGEETMPLRFDETGECPKLGQSIWLASLPAGLTAFSTQVEKYVKHGGFGEGSYDGNVLFRVHNKTCGFSAKVVYSGEDISVDLSAPIKCS